MKTLTGKAYGKINLALDVTGRREDGYHYVRMIMQTVDIYDTVMITESEPVNDSGIMVLADNGEVPSGPSNLVWRAADVMKREFGLKDALTIQLEKQIPVAAGMAGGSSDAAAVFRLIRQMYDLPVDNIDAFSAVKTGIDNRVGLVHLASRAVDNSLNDIFQIFFGFKLYAA